MYFTYFIGPAGSGKSTLTYTFADWIRKASMGSRISDNVSVACVNLDPGVHWTPYTPDVDVRDYVDYSEIVEKYNLGPNGALVAATDMILNHVEELKSEIRETNADYVIVDTPGQIELFSFRVAGPRICKELGGQKRATCFLFEPALANEPSGYMSLLLLSSAVEHRFFFPHLNLLAKADLLEETVLEEVITWSEEPYKLTEAIDFRTKGMEREKNLKMAQIFEEISNTPTLIPVSSKSELGMDALYAELQRIFKGGEDFESEE